jgi:hypothetical protein
MGTRNTQKLYSTAGYDVLKARQRRALLRRESLPGQACVATEADQMALMIYLEAISRAQALNRNAISAAARQEFSTDRILDQVIHTLDSLRSDRDW